MKDKLNSNEKILNIAFKWHESYGTTELLEREHQCLVSHRQLPPACPTLHTHLVTACTWEKGGDLGAVGKRAVDCISLRSMHGNALQYIYT